MTPSCRALARIAALAAAGLAWACGTAEGEGNLPEGAAGLAHRVVLAPAGEPGERLLVSGVLHDAAGSPLAGQPVHVFQTDSAGFYRRGPNGGDLGWRQARLSAWLRTAEGGRFEVDTIRPGSYPGRRTPAHIHFRIPADGGRQEHELTLYFEGDPRLTRQMRDHVTRFAHSVIRPLERAAGATWQCTVNLKLPD